MARLWAVEKMAHDLQKLGIIDFFEGGGTDPTLISGYSVSKLWLKVEDGVTTTSGSLLMYAGAGDVTDVNNWIAYSADPIGYDPTNGQSDVRLVTGTGVGIGSDTTWSERLIMVEPGATINVATGQTLTINSKIDADNVELFNGAGTVDGTFGGEPVKIAWWGVDTSISAANDTKFKAAVNAAAAAGVELDFGGLVYTNFAALRDTASDGTGPFAEGQYNWANFTIHNANGGSGVANIEISPVPPTVTTTVTADITAGDYTFDVADASSLSPNQRILIISNNDLYEAGNTLACKVSEYVTIKRIDTLTVTTFGQFKSDYLLTDTPKILDAERITTVSMKNAKFTCVGTTNEINLGIHFADIKEFYTDQRDAETTGVYFDQCSFSDYVKIPFNDIKFGYPVAFYGCDEPKLEYAIGRSCRHVVTRAHGDHDAGTSGWKPMNHGGVFKDIFGLDCTNSIVDSHQGSRDGHFYSVRGTCNPDSSLYPNEGGEAGQITDGITEESAGYTRYDYINIEGCHAGFAVQYYTAPEGAQETAFSIGSLNIKSPSTSTGAMVLQNLDKRNYSSYHVHVGEINSTGGAGVIMNSNQSGEEGGDIRLTIGHAKMVSQSNHTITTDPSANGRHFITINHADLDCDSALSTYQTIAAFGSTWYSANGNTPGSIISINTGSIKRKGDGTVNNIALRAYESEIHLGPSVETVATTGTITDESTSNGTIDHGANLSDTPSATDLVKLAAMPHTGTTHSTTDLPITHTVMALGDATSYDRNQVIPVKIGADNTGYATYGAGTSLTGTWNSRGKVTISSVDYYYCERTV
jgi:hypothetical protein